MNAHRDHENDRLTSLTASVAVPSQQRPHVLPSEQLLQGHRTVEISHNGELYRLHATRQGKLILTK
jgi:hemin uptake protein HemP